MQETYTVSLKKTWQYILSDLARYRVTEKRSYPALFIMCPGLIAGLYYRIGHWIWHPAELDAQWLYLLRPFYIIGKRLVEMYSGISFSVRAQVGYGLYINHFGSIFVGASVIGDNCNLSHEVTIGVAGRGAKRGLPTLGDRVYIGAGAKILGLITIGNDVAIGANAVVTANLDDCSVAVGVPARVISHDGSFDFVLYKNMENDSERITGLYKRDLLSSYATLETKERVKS